MKIGEDGQAQRAIGYIREDHLLSNNIASCLSCQDCDRDYEYLLAK